MLVVIHRLRAAHKRAVSRAKALHVKKKILLSLSQTLFALAIATAILAIFASYIGYGAGTLALFVLAVVALLILSYIAYMGVSEISFPDYVLLMFISGLLDQDAPVGMYGSLLFLGGLMVVSAPLVYTYLYTHPGLVPSPALYVLGVLLMGALFIVIAVVWYVRRILSP